MTLYLSLRRLLKIQVIMLLLLLSNYCHASDELLFQKLLTLAQQGNAEAQYNVGMMLNNGIGAEHNPRKAFNWFQKAADAGDPLGAYKLGCYYGGQFRVVTPDAAKELHYKLIAAKAGYSLAQYDVGIIYFTQNNFLEARHWWELAAKQGFPRSLYNLSAIYYRGQGVPKDQALAYAFLKLAIRAEGRFDLEAQSSLDQIKNEMSPDEVEKAGKIVSEWQINPTPLTIRAAAGIEEARKLVENAK